MRGHAHHRAGAVFTEHVVRDPDRDRQVGVGIDRESAGEETFLGDLAGHPSGAILRPELLRLRQERLFVFRFLRERRDQAVLRREHHERRAEDRVDARREDFDRIVRALDREAHARAFRSPDPVPLHRQDFFGPLRQPFGRLQQIVRVVGDLEEPLLEILLHHRRAAAPARAVDDLFVGEHGVVDRTPVHGRAPAIGQALLEHAREQPLVPVVVVRQAGRQLALPRVADPETLQLPLHVGDVAERGRFGVDAALDRGVLRGQAERVPPERVQDVETLQPLQPRDDVADDVVANVPDVRVPGGIREHFEAVELRLRRIFGDFKGAGLGPVRLPFPVQFLRVIFGHGDPSRITYRPRPTNHRNGIGR